MLYHWVISPALVPLHLPILPTKAFTHNCTCCHRASRHAVAIKEFIMKSPLLNRTDFFNCFSPTSYTEHGICKKAVGGVDLEKPQQAPILNWISVSLNMKGFPTQYQNPPRFYSVCTLQVSELCLCALNCKRDSGKSKHELLPKLLSLQRFPGFIP